MPSSRIVLALFAAAILLAFAPASSPAQAKPASPTDSNAAAKEIAAQIAVLQSAAPHERKLAACKRLGAIGGKESVAVLASLLSDENLTHPARIGLEAIPDPAATEALRSALPKLKGKSLVGVIHSLGARRDFSATSDLVGRLSDPDPQVASAAAFALGKFATPDAGRALLQALPSASPAVRPAVADACLTCAEAFRSQGKPADASALCGEVLKASLPEPLRCAALRGVIAAWQPGSAEVLAAQLKAKDRASFGAALGASREVAGPEATQVLLGVLAGLAPERQAWLIAALGDRGDPAARPVVLEAAQKSAPQARVAALRALAKLGDASTIPVLLAAAGQSDPAIAVAAQDSLSAMANPAIDADVAGLIEKTQGKSRRFLFDLAGRRQIAAAVPAMKAAASDADPEVRLAAIRALGRTIGPHDLPCLTNRLLAPANSAELAVVQQALKTACGRAADKKVCAEKLTACCPQASPATKIFVLELLGSVGDATALQAVGAAAFDANPQIQDAAIRILGKWKSAQAAAPLLDVVRKTADVKLRTRALRGYIRIVRQLDVSTEQRLVMCKEAMGLAQRDEERVLTLGALGRIPSAEALAQAAAQLNVPSLKEAASLACVSIAEKIVGSQSAVVASTMPKVLAATKNADVARRAKEVQSRAMKK
jgi:HEAT repeat protein